MTPVYPRILPDRDNYRRWYLDEDVIVELTNGDLLYINKGFRFDAHSVPFWARIFFNTDNRFDTFASLVHDYLVDTSPWHRYNRKFIDDEYTRFMKAPAYFESHRRTRWMPLAVRVWGYLKFDLWGDFRGESKPNTKVVVRVEYDDV